MNDIIDEDGKDEAVEIGGAWKKVVSSQQKSGFKKPRQKEPVDAIYTCVSKLWCKNGNKNKQ